MQSRQGDSDIMWMIIGTTVVLVCLILGTAFGNMRPPDQQVWQLEAIQHGYGRVVNGKFEWVPPAEWSARTRQQVEQRVEALVPEQP